MASSASPDGDPGFQIAPMVDVVFVLMLFFMASAGAQIKEKELAVALPGPSGVLPAPDRTPALPIIIEISADGQVVGNNTAFGASVDKKLPNLREWLKTTQSFGSQDPVLIRPNAQTRHERIVDVLNACREAGIKNVTFS